MDHDLISIVIPTFNAEATLARCLDSIVAQTHPHLEVVVVDGGSKDATNDIVRAYAARLPRLRHVSERDAGIYDAMNKGVALGGGEWLYFMGSDDELHAPDTLSAMASHFTPEVDFLYGDAMRMNSGRVQGGSFERHQLWIYNICHQAILYRRSLLARVGAFDLAYKVYADWDLNIRCFALPCRARHVEVTVCNYAGTGFSAHTVDRAFMEGKFARIAGLYGRSLWHPMFGPARHSFLHEARSWKERGRGAEALRFYALFAYHGLRARLTRPGRSGGQEKAAVR